MYEGAECKVSIDYQDRMKDFREISFVLVVCFELLSRQTVGQVGDEGHLHLPVGP